MFASSMLEYANELGAHISRSSGCVQWWQCSRAASIVRLSRRFTGMVLAEVSVYYCETGLLSLYYVISK